MRLRYLLCLFGMLIALPIAVLIAFAIKLPITISGIGYLLASSLVIVGLIIAPWRGKYSSLLIAIGVMGIAFVVSTRLILAAQQDRSNIKVIALPQGREIRWLNTLIDEQDALILGEALFHRIGGDSTREHQGLTDALRSAYSEMRKSQPIFVSPIVSTYLNLQRSTTFDVVIIEPETMRHPDVAVIFLHGYMGNVTAQCWEIAQAVGRFGAVTVCPSTDWTGQWWRPEGEAILQATFRYLREQGIKDFYLGGFSNGGFGISRLVSKISKEDGLQGLFFINGISDGTSIRETGLPVLILQGAQDERVPATHTSQVVGIIGDLGTYIELEGDHFMIMKQAKAVQSAIADWFDRQEPPR